MGIEPTSEARGPAPSLAVPQSGASGWRLQKSICAVPKTVPESCSPPDCLEGPRPGAESAGTSLPPRRPPRALAAWFREFVSLLQTLRRLRNEMTGLGGTSAGGVCVMKVTTSRKRNDPSCCRGTKGVMSLRNDQSLNFGPGRGVSPTRLDRKSVV